MPDFGELGSAMVAIRANLQPFQGDLDTAKSSFESTMGSIKQSAQSAAGALLPISAAFAAAGTASLVASGQFEATLTKMSTLAGVTGKDLATVKQHILDLAPAVGIGPQALADAMMVVSSTVEDTATGLQILDVAAKASASGMGETKDIARALTSIINSYGKENITAARAGDILTATVKAGGAEANEMAGTLGRVIPLASQMGVKFEEVGAFLATFTKLGVSSEEATTALSGTLNTLLKPSKEAEDALSGVGSSVAELRKQVREKGLTESMIELLGSFKGNETAAAAVFGNVRALAGIMGTAGSQAAVYAGVLKDLEKSTGLLDSAFEQMKGTQVQTWHELSAVVEVTAIQFGDALAPAFKSAMVAAKPMLEGIVAMAQGFAALPGPIQSVGIGLGVAAAAAAPLALAVSSVARVAGLASTGFAALTGFLLPSTAATIADTAATSANAAAKTAQAAAVTAAGTAVAFAAEEQLAFNFVGAAGTQIMLPLSGSIAASGAAATSAAPATLGLAGAMTALQAAILPVSIAIAAVWASWKIGNTETVKNAIASWALSSNDAAAELFRLAAGVDQMTPAAARAAVAATAAAGATKEQGAAAEAAASSYKNLKDQLSGALGTKNVEELTRVTRELSDAGQLDIETMRRLSTAFASAQAAGGQLSEEGKNIAKALAIIDAQAKGGGVVTLSAQYKEAQAQAAGLSAAFRQEVIDGEKLGMSNTDIAAAFKRLHPEVKLSEGAIKMITDAQKAGASVSESFGKKVAELARTFGDASEEARAIVAAFKTLNVQQLADVEVQQRVIVSVDKLISLHQRVPPVMLAVYEAGLKAVHAIDLEGEAILRAKEVTESYINTKKNEGQTEQQIAATLGVSTQALKNYLNAFTDVRKVHDLESALAGLKDGVGRLDSEELIAVRRFTDIADGLKLVERSIPGPLAGFESVGLALEGIGRKSTEIDDLKVKLGNIHVPLESLSSVLSGLAGDFTQLSQIAGGSFSDIAKAIGETIKIADMLVKAIQATSKLTAMEGSQGSSSTSNALAAAGAWGAVFSVILSFVSAMWDAEEAASRLERKLQFADNLGASFGTATTFSEELTASIRHLTDEMTKAGIVTNLAGAEGLMLSDIIKELGGIGNLTADQLKRVQTVITGWDVGGVHVSGLFDLIAKGGTLGAAAIKSLDSVLSDMGQNAIENGGLVDQFFLDMVAKAHAAGIELKGVAELMKAQVSEKIVGGLEKFTAPTATASVAVTADKSKLDDLKGQLSTATGDAQVKIQQEIDATNADLVKQQGIIAALAVTSAGSATALGAAADYAFQQMMASGMPILDILGKMTPVVNNLQAQFDAAGLSGGAAFADLKANVALASDAIAGPALQAVAGLGDVLTGLHNTGGLTQEMFTGLTDQIAGTFKTLVAGGADGDRVIRLMQQPLQAVWELHQQGKLAIDDETAAILKQAEANDVVGESHKSAAAQMQDGINRIATAAEGLARVFGVDIPDAAKTGGASIQDSLTKAVDPANTSPSIDALRKSFTTDLPKAAQDAATGMKTAMTGAAGPDGVGKVDKALHDAAGFLKGDGSDVWKTWKLEAVRNVQDITGKMDDIIKHVPNIPDLNFDINGHWNVPPTPTSSDPPEGYARGTRGIRDFGLGTLVMLHGREAVMTEEQLRQSGTSSSSGVASATSTVFAIGSADVVEAVDGLKGHIARTATATDLMAKKMAGAFPIKIVDGTDLGFGIPIDKIIEKMTTKTLPKGDAFPDLPKGAPFYTGPWFTIGDDIAKGIDLSLKKTLPKIVDGTDLGFGIPIDKIIEKMTTKTLPKGAFPGFATGSGGLRDFGQGTVATLHGREAVLTEDQFNIVHGQPQPDAAFHTDMASVWGRIEENSKDLLNALFNSERATGSWSPSGDIFGAAGDDGLDWLNALALSAQGAFYEHWKSPDVIPYLMLFGPQRDAANNIIKRQTGIMGRPGLDEDQFDRIFAQIFQAGTREALFPMRAVMDYYAVQNQGMSRLWPGWQDAVNDQDYAGVKSLYLLLLGGQLGRNTSLNEVFRYVADGAMAGQNLTNMSPETLQAYADFLGMPHIPMKAGGYGHAAGPMLFSTRGDEDFAFSGEGRPWSYGKIPLPGSGDTGPGETVLTAARPSSAYGAASAGGSEMASLRADIGSLLGIIARDKQRPLKASIYLGDRLVQAITASQEEGFIKDPSKRTAHLNALNLVD